MTGGDLGSGQCAVTAGGVTGSGEEAVFFLESYILVPQLFPHPPPPLLPYLPTTPSPPPPPPFICLLLLLSSLGV